jgi:hypothetical protein
MRVAITFDSCDGNSKITPAGATAGVLGNFAVGLTLPSLNLTIEQHGDIVTKPFTGQGIAGATSIIVVETFLDKV